MKSGLLSRELILPGENREEFDALLDQLVQEHKPLGVVETSLLERVAIAMWRQRRLVRAERARIWTQQQGGDAAGANKRSRYETMSDAELDASPNRPKSWPAIRQRWTTSGTRPCVPSARRKLTGSGRWCR